MKTCWKCGVELTNEKLRRERISKSLRNSKKKIGRPPSKLERTVFADMRNKGYSLREIGRQLGVSHRTVWRMLQGDSK